MKIAIVHDWLVTYGGADRVLEQMLICYPDADVFSLVDFLPEERRGFVFHKRANTSFIQHLPFARNNFRKYFALMPLAVEQFDFAGYDLVISNSHSVAKGVITGPDQVHICYCHSPMRYAWDLQSQYLQEAHLEKGVRGWFARWMLHRIRMWDLRTANGVDEFIANSHYISRRIRKAYRRRSRVVYPPVDIGTFGLQVKKDDFYLTVSRLVPYKRVKLIVEGFRRMPDKKLIVIGDGPAFDSTKAVASSNVTMLGYQSFEVVREYMQRAQGFVFAAEEDFGICVAEAQACGTPVIAFGKGGALEIVRDLDAEEPTGLFFGEQTPEAIVEAVETFQKVRHRFDPTACRRNVTRFSAERFREEFHTCCENAMTTAKEILAITTENDELSNIAAQV